jgi:hypothetical protein
MQTRSSKLNWLALCTGLLLVTGSAAPTSAGNGSNSKSSDNAPPQQVTSGVDCPPEGVRCPRRRYYVCRHCYGRGCGFCGGPCFVPVDGNYNYCDPRDLRLYSAQGYNVPVTVPLAPICRTFNYGWGIPSSRLTQVGDYAAWWPERPFSQSGGRLPGGLYPMIYHPTDTTQLGYFYNYVPTWQPRRW